MKHLMIVLSLIVAFMFTTLPAANAKIYWERRNSSSDSVRLGDDVKARATIFYRSGTTKPRLQGRKRLQVTKFVYAYSDSRDNSCERVFGRLNNVYWKIEIENSAISWSVGGRRAACDPDGNGRIVINQRLNDSPIFGSSPRWRADVKAEFDRGNDKDGDLNGRLNWLGLSHARAGGR